MQNSKRLFSTTFTARAAASKSVSKGPASAKKTPASSGAGKKGISAAGSNDSRNQLIKQILYDKEHQVAAERRRVGAIDAARLKKRLSPVEYARDKSDPEQVSRQEKDFIERVYSLYKMDEFKIDFDRSTRHSLSIITALKELQKVDSNLFTKCFQPLSPSEATFDESAEDALSSSSSNLNQQVALSADSAPLPLFPRRMRIPAETLSSNNTWDYEMLPPSQ